MQCEQKSSTKPDLVFFDIETTIPRRRGEGYHLLEFGAVVVDSTTLQEKRTFRTLVRPPNLKVISYASVECNHISQRMADRAPPFFDVAPKIASILDGQIWCGHNIKAFDMPRLAEHFAAIGSPAPSAAGVIDTLPLLRKTFGAQRAGDLKLVSLGKHFGLGMEEHRALADAKMNWRVLQVILCSSFSPHASCTRGSCVQ